MAKEYFLKLSEQHYSELSDNEKIALNYWGLQVRQLPDNNELNDPIIAGYKKEIARNYDKIDKHLFEKRKK